MERFIYPMERLLGETAPFIFIENRTGIPEEVLRQAFYKLFEVAVQEVPELEELHTVIYEFEGEDFSVSFNTGHSIIFELQEGAPPSYFSSKEEELTSMEVFHLLMKEIRKKLPEEWKEEFCLREVPSMENNWLLNTQEDRFEGEVYRTTDPEQTLKFTVLHLGEKNFDVTVSGRSGGRQVEQDGAQ